MSCRWPVVLACLLLWSWLGAVGAEPCELEVFTRDGCPHCAAAQAFLAELVLERPTLVVVSRDIARDAAARARFTAVMRAHDIATPGVPAMLCGERLLVGFESAATTGVELRHMLDAAAPGAESGLPDVDAPVSSPAVPRLFGVELDPHRLGLAVFSVALGLVDGFNPCSMWVLLFTLAMLAPLRDRRRMLAVAGTFVLVEGLAYFVFMAAWLNAFALLGVSRLATAALGLLGIAAGLVHVKDFFALGRGFSLSIPAAAKPGIYARVRRVMLAENLAAAVAATIVLAALVQAVEFLCTAGIPALFTRIVSLHEPQPWRRYLYLLVYDLAYMFDDLLVLGVGVVTLSQHRLQAREGRWLKLLAGLTLVALGAYLLLRAA
ncbi:MAG: NrdH-redoxin [Gammaproteobacteria bacterium]